MGSRHLDLLATFPHTGNQHLNGYVGPWHGGPRRKLGHEL